MTQIARFFKVLFRQFVDDLEPRLEWSYSDVLACA